MNKGRPARSGRRARVWRASGVRLGSILTHGDGGASGRSQRWESKSPAVCQTAST